jgi:hypothetical protein
MKQLVSAVFFILAVAAPAFAGTLPIITKCPPDAALVGRTCVDKYEASVWEVPATNLTGKSNAGLINGIKKGTAKQTALTAGGATQKGVVGDDHPATCPDTGQGCADLYAVSLPGVPPSAYVSWFQAQQACANSGKRLPSNAEWQTAVSGTPDPGGDNGTTDCNTASVGTVVHTGSRSSCVSRWGNFDMVGNVYEWVADWAPESTACPGWGSFSDDEQCFAGADTSSTFGPAALSRGGNWHSGSGAGPLAVVGGTAAFVSPINDLGFRCAR